MKKLQKILVFQQNGSGLGKIKAIEKYASDRIDLEIISIDDPLPDVIDDGETCLPDEIEADLVLDYLKHPDLSYDLGRICAKRGIPVVASAKKHRIKGVFTPPTCCGLPRQDCLESYGEQFGAPEYEVEIEDGKIADAKVLRGAPCGASWDAAKKIIGLKIEEAIVRIGLETQFFCIADPAGWDPIYGKSPVHFAGNVHSAALKKAVKMAGFRDLGQGLGKDD